MPTQHTITLYTFSELSNAKAKERARQWYRDASLDDEWYNQVFEDAEQAGLKITAFDCGRADSCELEFTEGAFNTCKLIKENHGEECATRKAADAYEKAVCALPAIITPEMEDANTERLQEIEAEFLKDLSRAYLESLRDELEYFHSDEYIDEALNANEYTFLANGKRFEPLTER